MDNPLFLQGLFLKSILIRHFSVQINKFTLILFSQAIYKEVTQKVSMAICSFKFRRFFSDNIYSSHHLSFLNRHADVAISGNLNLWSFLESYSNVCIYE
jgi:hypothetical protein